MLSRAAVNETSMLFVTDTSETVSAFGFKPAASLLELVGFSDCEQQVVADDPLSEGAHAGGLCCT